MALVVLLNLFGVYRYKVSLTTAALPTTHLDGSNHTDYNNIDHMRASFKMFGFAWRAAGCVVVMAQALLLFILGLVTPSMEVSQWWMGVEPVNLYPLFQI